MVPFSFLQSLLKSRVMKEYISSFFDGACNLESGVCAISCLPFTRLAARHLLRLLPPLARAARTSVSLRLCGQFAFAPFRGEKNWVQRHAGEKHKND